MWKTIIRRLIILIPQLLVISAFLFFLAWHMPGDALTGMGEDPTVNREQLEIRRQELGLNDPWPQQYLRWLGNLVRGDFGQSVNHHRDVLPLIGERLTNTFWLALMTIILIYLIAIPLGIVAGRYNDKIPDRLIGIYTYFALALPVVVFALVVLLIFGFRLGWVPTRGSVTLEAYAAGGVTWFLSRLHHMVAPALTAALLGTIFTIQFLRSQIVNLKTSDYVMTARSKGTPESKIYTRHILRNSLIPVAANAGLVIVGLFSGAILLETVFTFPGMGRLFMDSIQQRDFTVVNAIVMITSFLTAMGVLLSDIILAALDPRIRIK